jgi:hypothetical protein
VFGYPTVERLSAELGARLFPPPPSPAEEARTLTARLHDVLSSLPGDDPAGPDLRAALRRSLALLGSDDGGGQGLDDRLATAGAQEVLDFIDRELA